MHRETDRCSFCHIRPGANSKRHKSRTFNRFVLRRRQKKFSGGRFSLSIDRRIYSRAFKINIARLLPKFLRSIESIGPLNLTRSTFSIGRTRTNQRGSFHFVTDQKKKSKRKKLFLWISNIKAELIAL